MNREKIISIFVLIIFILIGIGKLLYNVTYSEPNRFKKSLQTGMKENYPKLPDSCIKSYIDCIYNKFETRYGYSGLFPEYDEYTYEDKSDIFDCTMQFLVVDSLVNYSAEQKDSIISQM